MDKDLQGKLVEILTSIQNGVGQAKDFAIGQLPDIAQSYVAYGRAMESVQLAMSVFLFASGLWAIVWAVRSDKVDKYDFWAAERVVAAVAGAVGSLLGLIVSMVQVSSFALVWMAPKVWLLKELARLVK